MITRKELEKMVEEAATKHCTEGIDLGYDSDKLDSYCSGASFVMDKLEMKINSLMDTIRTDEKCISLIIDDKNKLKKELTAANERIKELEDALKDAWNKLDCCIVGCYHKTKLVNSSMCSAHTSIYNALTPPERGEE